MFISFPFWLTAGFSLDYVSSCHPGPWPGIQNLEDGFLPVFVMTERISGIFVLEAQGTPYLEAVWKDNRLTIVHLAPKSAKN